MYKLYPTLQNADEGQLYAIAETWAVRFTGDHEENVVNIMTAMLDPDQAEAVWDTLDENARGALLFLLSSQGKTAVAQFERLYGKVRRMGRGRVERDAPHVRPESTAEALFYRGLIAETYTQAESGAHPIYYVPPDLLEVLPVRRTSYSSLEDNPVTEAADVPDITPLDESDLSEVQAATTTLVDDMTTLLAYLRIHTAGVEDGEILPVDRDRIVPHLLTPGADRLSFLVGVGASAGLIQVQDGRAYPVREGLQRWLDKPRYEQVRQLAEAWRESRIYADLWHVEGLYPEDGWSYDPTVARSSALELLASLVPQSAWWSIDDFIETVHTVEPDFQRPGGDYDSWYIRNDEGDYLNGFDSWYAVDGALLEHLLLNPLHWLGLVDIAEDACRLTAYGRAFLEHIDWPHPADRDERVGIQEDGKLIVSRHVSRYDRFQVARFSTWMPPKQGYVYRLDADGIAQAAEQGITTDHIVRFLKRQIDEGASLPATIQSMLDVFHGDSSTDVTFEQVLIMRTLSPEVMDRLYNDPAFRRYLGARLGPMACVILQDKADDLHEALQRTGIQVDTHI